MEKHLSPEFTIANVVHIEMLEIFMRVIECHLCLCHRIRHISLWNVVSEDVIGKEYWCRQKIKFMPTLGMHRLNKVLICYNCIGKFDGDLRHDLQWTLKYRCVVCGRHRYRQWILYTDSRFTNVGCWKTECNSWLPGRGMFVQSTE